MSLVIAGYSVFVEWRNLGFKWPFGALGLLAGVLLCLGVKRGQGMLFCDAGWLYEFRGCVEFLRVGELCF